VGQGQLANPGDATWSYAFSNTSPWSKPGGDFVSTASAVTSVGGLTLNVPFIWGSTSQMVADVQQWLDHPSSNFGWILRGQETDPGTFRGFYTREETTAAYRPALTVDYVLPQPAAIPEPPTLRLALVAMAIIGIVVVCRSSRRGVLRASNDSSSLLGPRPDPA
jgi:hypothetical protein